MSKIPIVLMMFPRIDLLFELTSCIRVAIGGASNIVTIFEDICDVCEK